MCFSVGSRGEGFWTWLADGEGLEGATILFDDPESIEDFRRIAIDREFSL